MSSGIERGVCVRESTSFGSSHVWVQASWPHCVVRVRRTLAEGLDAASRRALVAFLGRLEGLVAPLRWLRANGGSGARASRRC